MKKFCFCNSGFQVVVFFQCVLLVVFSIGANAKSLYTTYADHISTSDDFDLMSYGFQYRNNQRSFFWPYREELQSTIDKGINFDVFDGDSTSIDFSGRRIVGLLGHRFSGGSYFSVSLGANQISTTAKFVEPGGDRRNHEEQFVVGMSSRIVLNRQLEVYGDFLRDYVYQLGVQPSTVNDFHHANMGTVGVDFKPVDDFRVSWQTSIWKLSDSNMRRQHNLALMYGISIGQPWIWAGIKASVLHYDDAAPGYWSPDRSETIGAAFEGSFPVIPGLSASISASVDWLKENGESGDGSSLFAGADWALKEHYTLRIGYSRMVSTQDGSDWRQNGIGLSLNGQF